MPLGESEFGTNMLSGRIGIFLNLIVLGCDGNKFKSNNIKYLHFSYYTICQLIMKIIFLFDKYINNCGF